MGRKPKLTPHQIKEARQRIAKGEKTRDLAKSYGVSRSTIFEAGGINAITLHRIDDLECTTA